jgi:tetratricopeptide (TPR) repeat protein
VELDPLSPIILVNYGNSLEQFNRDEEAQATYRRALEIDPTFLAARSALELTGDEDLALLSATYPLAQSDPWLLLEFVLRWLDIEDEERAGQWLAHLEALAPDDTPTLIARMQVNLFRQDLDASAAVAQQLLPVEIAGMPIPTRLLAIRDIRAGDPGAALARYEGKYPGMFTPVPPVAEHPILASDIALVLLELGETDRARGILRTALDALIAVRRERGPHPEIPEARIHALLGEDEAEALSARRAGVDMALVAVPAPRPRLREPARRSTFRGPGGGAVEAST